MLTAERWAVIEPILGKYASYLFSDSDLRRDAMQETALVFHTTNDVRNDIQFGRAVLWRKHKTDRRKNKALQLNFDVASGERTVEQALVAREDINLAILRIPPRYRALIRDEELMVRRAPRPTRQQANAVHRAKMAMRQALTRCIGN